MRLHLVRHPQPDVAAGVCYGATDLTVAASEIDRVLADLGARLPPRLPLYSSVLQRCTLLATPLAHRCDSGTVRHDVRLVEMNFGRWEMQPWDDIARSEIDAWTENLIDYRPGEGESVTQVAQRVRSFLTDLLHSGDDEVIVVCHAGTIRLLLAWSASASIAEIAQRAATTSHAIGYGSVVVMNC